MLIPPRDQRRLLIRVCAVLIAMRAVSMFSVDLDATEVASVHAMAADGMRAPVLSQLMAAWAGVSGYIAGILRLPVLFADLGLLLVAVAWARTSQWGTIAGLAAGLILAMAPLGLDEGWRADGTPILSLATLGALYLLRRGIKEGQVLPIAISALAIGAAIGLSPVALVAVPAGLFLAGRAVTGPTPKLVALAGWLIVPTLAMGARFSMDALGPGLGLATAWMGNSGLNGAGITFGGAPLQAAWETFVAVSGGGPTGELAGLIGVAEAPSWRVFMGLSMWPLALVGLLKGQVQPDPPVPKSGAVSMAAGAGAADGWRALGVAAPTAPRILGDRDWGPLLVGILGACGWVAFASWRGSPAGVAEALAVARPLAALLVGLGITALAGMRIGVDRARDRRRFVMMMVAWTLLQVGLGGHHVLATTSTAARTVAHKVASFIRDEGGGGKLLALGPAGLAVAFKLDRRHEDARILRASIAPSGVLEALDLALQATPAAISVAGDHLAIDTPPGQKNAAVPATGWLVDRSLTRAGYALIEDGARYLATTSVRIYRRDDRPAIRPQIAPGVAPE